MMACPPAHEGNARAALGLVQVRRAHDDRDPAFCRRWRIFQKSRRETGSTPVVGSSRKMMPRRVDQRAGQGELLLHAAGELARRGATERGQPGELEQRVPFRAEVETPLISAKNSMFSSTVRSP